jgi:hypothetical protein
MRKGKHDVPVNLLVKRGKEVPHINLLEIPKLSSRKMAMVEKRVQTTSTYLSTS